MFFTYFAIIGVFSATNVICHSLRLPRLASANNQEEAILARYKIKNGKPNYDPTIAQNVHADNFPDVEYPGNIVDSSKPFYMNISPFSNDVKTSFNSLAPGGNKKQNPTILNVKSSQKEKNKPAVKPKTINANSRPFVINLNVKSNQTIPKEKDLKENRMENKVVSATNSTEDLAELTDSEEMEYVIEFIDDLDKFICDIETEFIDLNTTAQILSSGRSETPTITSEVTSVNNDADLNEDSLSSPVFDKPNDSVTASVNKDTITSLSNDTQYELGDIEEQ